MSKMTLNQRLERVGVPYTKVITVMAPEVDTSGEVPVVRFESEYHVLGFICEEKWVADEDGEGDWKLEWEQIELGVQPSLNEAYKAAAEWRESLVDLAGSSGTKSSD